MMMAQHPCENHPNRSATHRARPVYDEPPDPGAVNEHPVYVCGPCAALLRASNARVNLEVLR